MKKIDKILLYVYSAVIIGLVLALSHAAWGAPYLVSDPPGPCGESGQPACPVTADIYMDGAVIASDIPLEPDLSIRYDMISLPHGEHVYTAKYKDGLGRESDFSNPYLLLSKPQSPQGLRGTP